MSEVLSRLSRTMQGLFRIGDVNVKDESGEVALRNFDDSAYVDVAVKNVQIHGNNVANAVILSSPNGLGGNITLTLPNSVGASGQFLQSDGSGGMSWANANSNGNLIQYEAFTQATSSPLTIFTPPDDSVILEVYVEVIDSAGGGSPTVTIGTSVDPDAYMTATENDLTEEAVYIVHPLVEVGGSPNPVIATIVTDSQTFGGEIYVGYSNAS
jgi:hypothetical protein